MRRSFVSPVAALLALLVLPGCLAVHPSVALDDEDMTTYDLEDRTEYGTPLSLNNASPPVYVHDFDTDHLEAAGGRQLGNGQDWLEGSDAERNQMLIDARKQLGEGETLILIPATGELWSFPDGAGDLVLSGEVAMWTYDDYDELDDYYVAPDELTRSAFDRLTSVGSMSDSAEIYLIHDLGTVGQAEIKSVDGFLAITPKQWNELTPDQRAVDLTSISGFVSHMSQFQGKGNKPVYGISVSWGGVYVAPEQKYDTLVGTHAIQPWNSWETYALPGVVTGREDRWRHEQSTFDIVIRREL